MEGYHRQHAAGVQQVMGMFYGLSKLSKLAVHLNAYSLKCSAGRVRTFPPVGGGYCGFYYFCKLYRAVYGFLFPLPGNGVRHSECETFLAVFLYYICQLLHAISVHHIICGKGRSVVHSHIQRRILVV